MNNGKTLKSAEAPKEPEEEKNELSEKELDRRQAVCAAAGVKPPKEAQLRFI